MSYNILFGSVVIAIRANTLITLIDCIYENHIPDLLYNRCVL